MSLKIQHLDLQIGKRFLYRDMNLTFQTGEIWGVLGANGCGKTTLLHIIAGLRQAQGKITWRALSLQDMKTKQRAQQIGLLFQETILPPLQTVFEYVYSARYPHLKNFDKKHHISIVMSVLNQLALLQYKDTLVSQLSGGEKRRVAIASLFAQTPTLYLLDEPTNHLDLPYQLTVLRQLQQLAALQKIVMMSLHDPQHVQAFCTHALLLLPNGAYLQGETQTCLNAVNLTSLYGHDIMNVGNEHHPIWQPVY